MSSSRRHRALLADPYRWDVATSGGCGVTASGGYAGGGYALAFVTAAMGSHARATTVENAVRECLGMPPLDE